MNTQKDVVSHISRQSQKYFLINASNILLPAFKLGRAVDAEILHRSYK